MLGSFVKSVEGKGQKKQENYYHATIKGNLPIKNEKP